MKDREVLHDLDIAAFIFWLWLDIGIWAVDAVIYSVLFIYN